MERQRQRDGDCARWESAITDLLDGTLSQPDELRLREHAVRCSACRSLLEEAEQGRNWVRLLHDEPPMPPPELLGKILSRTEVLPPPAVLGDALLLPHPAQVQSRQRAHSLMTVAMAFFSIALTFSVTGLHIADLRPSVVEQAATRHLFNVKKQVWSFYDNLPVVREVETGLDAFRLGRDSSTLGPQTPGDMAAERKLL